MFQEDNNPNAGVNLRGIKIAKVVSNFDPKCQERVLVRVLGVHNMNNHSLDNAIWANHCAPTRDASGDIPEPDDYIYGMFPNEKDPMSFIWMGFVRSSFQFEGEENNGTTDETE